jgi:hypothetical protein
MSRLIPGPHLGFYVAPAHWKDALAQLDRLGILNGDRGEEAKNPLVFVSLRAIN